MDAKVLESLTALLNQALTAQLVATALISLIAAGAGSYIGAYLTKKGERLAAKEDFADVLKEQIETTFETERVKTAIANAAATSLEQFKTDLQQRITSLTFWRERAAKMKDMMFESALALDTLLENCQSVPWLAKTSVESIHDAGHTQIARVNYALGQLRQMNVVDDKRRNTVSLLGYIFKRFAGAVAEYKEQIVAGNITLLGDVNAISKPALKELMKTAGEWREQLELLSSLVAWLATAPEPSFDTSDSQTPPDNDTHSTADTEVVK